MRTTTSASSAGAGDVGEGTRALTWSVDGPQVPGPLTNSGSSLAHDVNDLGDLAGQSETGDEDAYVSRAFFLGHAGYAGNLGGVTGEYSSAALAVNERGQAAGYAESGDATHAVVFDPTNGWTDLDSLDNVYSVAHGINDEGLAVGLFVRSHEDDDRAFVASADGMADLNELVETDQPWLLVEARAINNAGQIAGYGLVNERERAFLLTPVKQPAGAARPQIRILQPAPRTQVRRDPMCCWRRPARRRPVAAGHLLCQRGHPGLRVATAVRDGVEQRDGRRLSPGGGSGGPAGPLAAFQPGPVHGDHRRSACAARGPAGAG
jgi:uncharacterized membrane protein